MSNKHLITFVEINNYKKVFPLIGLQYSCEMGLLNDKVSDISNKSLIL